MGSHNRAKTEFVIREHRRKLGGIPDADWIDCKAELVTAAQTRGPFDGMHANGVLQG